MRLLLLFVALEHSSMLKRLLKHLLCCLLLCQGLALHEVLSEISIPSNNFVLVRVPQSLLQLALKPFEPLVSRLTPLGLRRLRRHLLWLHALLRRRTRLSRGRMLRRLSARCTGLFMNRVGGWSLRRRSCRCPLGLLKSGQLLCLKVHC